MPLSHFQEELQKSLQALKSSYHKKRLFFMDRLTEHKASVDAHFKVYYKALDELREKLLADENRY